MGKRTSYTPGTFSWVDLGTPDAAAAKSFYTAMVLDLQGALFTMFAGEVDP